jgi:hypothetical protein
VTLRLRTAPPPHRSPGRSGGAVRRRGAWLPCVAALLLGASAPALAQKFGKNKITYEDFDWHVYKAPHFDVYYYPEEEAFLEQVVSYAESAYVTISQGLQHEIRFRIPLIYYKTHAEFEQTNVTLSFVPEAVGAFAEPTQKRIVLPIDLPPNELYALIAHELTHIFEYSLLFQDSLGREVRGNPPLWLMEGLASFMAQDEDSFDLMFIRDGVVNGLLPGLEQLNVLHFLTYRYGHAIFDFIQEEFGMEGVRNFLLEFRKVLLARNLEKAIKEAFGWEIQEFDRRFHKYLRAKYLPLLLEKDEPSDYGKEIAFTSEEHRRRYFHTLSPTLSPSGDLFAALTTRFDDYEFDVVIFSARDGEPVRNLTAGYTTDYESISVGFYRGWKDLAWSPDGDRIAFFARKGNRWPLFIYHAVTGKKLAEVSIDIQKLASPSFSPDGRRVAFAGNRRGVVDIFSVDLETREVRNHTEDEYYDSNPSWSADGKQILYNRRLQAYEKVFMVDAADSSRKTQLTFGATSDIQPSFSADGRYVYYSSDYGDDRIYNIYGLDLTDGVVRRYTDVVGGSFSPLELNPDASGRRRLAYTSFFRQRFQIYELPLDEPLQVLRPGQPPDPPQPRRAGAAGGRRGGAGGAAPPARRPAEAPGGAGGLALDPAGSSAGGQRGPEAGAPASSPWRLRALESAPERAVAAAAPARSAQEPPAAGGPGPLPAEVEKFEPPLKLRIDESEKSRYTKKKWSIDGHPQVLFGVADDGTILSDSFIIFSDLLGDYRHFVQLRSVSSFTDFDYIFLNLKRRYDWFVHVQDKRDYFIVGRTSTGLDRRQALRTTGAEFAYRYPVSLFHRFDTAIGYFDRSQEIPFLRETSPGLFEVDSISNDVRFPRLSASFTGDTTRFRSFGPYHGRRYDFTVQYAPTVSGDTRNIDGEEVEAERFFNYFIDFRSYSSWTRRSLFALRLFSAVSNGNNSTDIYSFGGFNTLRGYEFREFFGNRIAFMNAEIRFPLVDQLRLPFGAINEIRGLLFFDIGAGWFSGGDTCDLTVDPDPGNPFTEPECSFFFDRGVPSSAPRRIFDDRTSEFRPFDFWDSKEGRLRDGRASYGIGFNFYFGPFELNWVFARALPFLEVNPFTGESDVVRPSGYASAFYIGRKF